VNHAWGKGRGGIRSLIRRVRGGARWHTDEITPSAKPLINYYFDGRAKKISSDGEKLKHQKEII